MRNYKNFVILLAFLAIIQFACTIERIDPVTPTPISTKIVTPKATKTATCTPIPIISPEIGVISAEKGVYLRAFPTENSDSVLIILAKEEVEILEHDLNGWTKVCYKDSRGIYWEGYINSKYLSLK